MKDILLQIEPLIPGLRRYARALMNDRGAADDLVQNCLERAVATWHRRRKDRDPRSWLAQQQSGRSRRANAAQANGFEAFPAFAAAVIIAQLAGVDPQRIGWLALAFVAFRVLHGLFYVANNHRMRSLVWFGGMGCVVTLYGSALLQAG